MKNYFIITLLLVASIVTVQAQDQEQPTTFLQRVSVDASAAFNLPVSSTFEDFKGSDYAGFRSFNLGANYAINNLWGLRFTYGLNSFKYKNDSSMGLTMHKFMAEGTFNIVQFIEMQENPFEVMAHAGAGMSLGKSSLSDDIDMMGTIQVGLMPIYHISNNLSIQFDATYVVNMKQNYNYNGMPATNNGQHVTGEYLMFNLGLRLKLGL